MGVGDPAPALPTLAPDTLLIHCARNKTIKEFRRWLRIWESLATAAVLPVCLLLQEHGSDGQTDKMLPPEGVGSLGSQWQCPGCPTDKGHGGDTGIHLGVGWGFRLPGFSRVTGFDLI